MGQTTGYWTDTYVSRLQLLAVLESLNVELLSSRSATLTLERWCGEHRLADPARVEAKQLMAEQKPATVEQRKRLEVTGVEEVRYRRVQLSCGDHVLSLADNWYVPARLTAEMNGMLESTSIPFGRVVRPLEPYRRTLEVKLLWSPLADLWQQPAKQTSRDRGAPMPIPQALIEHRALLYTGAHQPFSEVDEVYQRPLLDFAPPGLPPRVKKGH